MNRFRRYALFSGLVFAVLIISLLLYRPFFKQVTIEQYTSIDRPARIHPDYCDTVIPPNIAPLNFFINETGKNFYVRIYSENGDTIEVRSRNGKIEIPTRKWSLLLRQNRNKHLFFDIFVRTSDDKWEKFNTIKNKIAEEASDSFLCYRKIHPVQSLWSDMGIYQRNISNFNESLILGNDYFRSGCLNCHTFCNNNPEKALFVIRSEVYGNDTIIVQVGSVRKIGTKFTYPAWHPSGKVVTFSSNMVRLFFHSSNEELRDVIDLDSLMAYYIVDSNTVKASPSFSRKDYLETYPTWSPDGKFLYFCTALIPWQGRDKIPPDNYQVKYDLVRISYNIETDQWGTLETIVSSKDTRLSISMPRISPDGRWLLLCMADYGCFNVYSQSSDLYLIDLEQANQTGRFIPRRLEINSSESESWHCWSSNSRWIVFSSKRDYGVFTKLYISYVDDAGNVHKPFVLPQKDPLFYESCLLTYNTPELIIKPVPATGENLAKVIRSSQKISVDMPVTMATPKAEATSADSQYRNRE